MSELITANPVNNFHKHLLVTVSALSLMVACHEASGAEADSNRPTVWVELGGQLERVDTPQAQFAPPFFDLASQNSLNAMTSAQRPSRYSTGAEGKFIIEPSGTNWVFTAAIRYGRVKNNRHLHYQSAGLAPPLTYFSGLGGNQTIVHPTPAKKVFGDGQTRSGESHFVLDFEAGKDVGLGLFGASGSAVVSAGVKFAQFTSNSEVTLRARPFYGFNQFSSTLLYGLIHKMGNAPYYASYTAVLNLSRSTRAAGPSISWDASIPLAGNSDGMSLTFDWGANAAALFGRQRTQEIHHTSGYNVYGSGLSAGDATTQRYTHRPAGISRSRSVFIPNVGGFAGLSLKFPNAKISLGYRADFFFNAADNGIEAQHTVDRSFYGPYATISFGLGD